MQWQVIEKNSTCIIAECTLPLTIYRLVWFRRGEIGWWRAFAVRDPKQLDWRITPGINVPNAIVEGGMAVCRCEAEWFQKPTRTYTKRKPATVAG